MLSMKHTKYERAVVEIFLIDKQDVVTSSGGGGTWEELAGEGGNGVPEPDSTSIWGVIR